MPSVEQSLSDFCYRTLPKALLGSFLASFLPLSDKYLLGNRGDPFFAAISPILLLVACGLVCVIWWVLVLVMWPIGKLGSYIFGRYVQ